MYAPCPLLDRRGAAMSFCLLVMLFLAASAPLIYVDDRVALSSVELTQSRGANQGKQEGTFQCDALSGYRPSGLLLQCIQAGFDCTTCSDENGGPITYKDVGSAGGQYNPGAANGGDCGDIWNGTCTFLLACNANAGGDTGDACTAPPGKPPQQQQNP